MTKYVLTIVSFFLGLSCFAQDKPYEKVHLKNGTIMSGFISSQIPGKIMTINPSWLEIVVPEKDVTIKNTDFVELTSLSAAWKQWAKNNPLQVKTKNGKQYIKLAYLSFSAKSQWSHYKNAVRIIDQGDGFLKYVVPSKDIDDNSIEIPSDSVVEIERNIREENCLSGIVDSIVTKYNNRYVGQIVKIIPGKTITIQDYDGDFKTIKLADIKTQNRKVLNKTQNWKEQILFMDKVRNGDHTYVGLILEQTYDRDKNIIMMKTVDGDLTSINIEEIKELGKSKNEAYSPIYRSKLKDNEVNVCKKSLVWCKAYDNSNANKRIVLPMDSLQTIKADSCGKTINVVLKNIKANTDVNLYNANILPKVFNKKETGIGLYTASCFDNKVKEISTETNEQTINLKYPVKRGYYILFRGSDNCAVIFKIE